MALELNIYFLPSDFRRSGDENENVYFDIINDAKKFITIPFAVKIGYYFSSLAQTVQKLSETGTKGLVLFNRPYNTDIDIEKLVYPLEIFTVSILNITIRFGGFQYYRGKRVVIFPHQLAFTAMKLR